MQVVIQSDWYTVLLDYTYSDVSRHESIGQPSDRITDGCSWLEMNLFVPRPFSRRP